MNIDKDDSGKMYVTFPYYPQLVAKVKTIKGRKWYKDRRYWSFPNTNVTLEMMPKAFEAEEIYIDPILQAKKVSSPIAGDGYKFEDLHREYISRIYTQVNTKDIGRIKSPLDSLNLKEGGDI